MMQYPCGDCQRKKAVRFPKGSLTALSYLKTAPYFFGLGARTRSVSVVDGWVFAYFLLTIRPVLELRLIVLVFALAMVFLSFVRG